MMIAAMVALCLSIFLTTAAARAEYRVTVTPQASQPLYSDHPYRFTFRWRAIDEERWIDEPIKVKFLDQRGAVLWVETHEIPVIPYDFRAGRREFSYTVPVWLAVQAKNRTLRIQVFKGDHRCQTSGEIAVLRAEHAPLPPKVIEVIPGAGWYSIEQDPATKQTWRWMARESTLKLRNPAEPAVLFLKGRLPQEQLRRLSGFHVIVNDHEVDYVIPRFSIFSVYYELPTELLGDRREVILTLRVDDTFSPADHGSSDTRILGLMLQQLYFKPQP